MPSMYGDWVEGWKAGRSGSTRNPKKSERRDQTRMNEARAVFLHEQENQGDVRNTCKSKKMNEEDFIKSIKGIDPKDAKNMVLYFK